MATWWGSDEQTGPVLSWPGTLLFLALAAASAQAAAQSNPHRRRTAHQPPRVPSSEAFGRRPPARLHSSANGPASETLHESRHSRSGQLISSAQTQSGLPGNRHRAVAALG